MYTINKSILLIMFDYKKYTKFRLMGVSIDKKKLEKFFKELNFKINILDDNTKEIKKNYIANIISNSNPSFIWIGGHGELNFNKNNQLIFPEFFNNQQKSNLEKYILDYEFLDILQNNCSNIFSSKKLLFIVVDVCYAGTFINLKYYYQNGVFMEKINDKEKELILKNCIIVAISASTDFTQTGEDVNGGFLTKKLLSFLMHEKKLCLNDLDMLTPSNDNENYKVIVSVSEKINPLLNLFDFNYY